MGLCFVMWDNLMKVENCRCAFEGVCLDMDTRVYIFDKNVEGNNATWSSDKFYVDVIIDAIMFCGEKHARKL